MSSAVGLRSQSGRVMSEGRGAGAGASTRGLGVSMCCAASSAGAASSRISTAPGRMPVIMAPPGNDRRELRQRCAGPSRRSLESNLADLVRVVLLGVATEQHLHTGEQAVLVQPDLALGGLEAQQL